MISFSCQLLAQAVDVTRTGLEPSYYHRFPFPPWVSVLVLIVAVLFVLMVSRRRKVAVAGPALYTLVSLRIALLLLTLFMLHGWMRQQHVTDLPDLVILLDESASMDLEDLGLSDGDRDRWGEQVRQLLGDVPLSRFALARAGLIQQDGRVLKSLAALHQLKVFTIGESLQFVEARGAGDLVRKIRRLKGGSSRSRLGSAVREILQLQRGRPTTAIIVISDGTTTEGPTIAQVAARARQQGIPLFLVGLGSPRGPLDLELADLVADRVAFVEDLVTVDLRLTAAGIEQETVRVELRSVRNDQLLAEREVVVSEQQPSQRVRLSFRPTEAGEQVYRIQAAPLAGESDLQNNSLEHHLLVRDEAIRVLLVQEYPSFEYRLLKNLLGRTLQQSSGTAGQLVELVVVLQEADPGVVQSDDALASSIPVSREELFEFDVIVFGDVNPQLLGTSVMENLHAFVSERGGGIVFLAGPRHTPTAYQETPLESLFPVRLEAVSRPLDPQPGEDGAAIRLAFQGKQVSHVMLSTDAEQSARLWQSMPPLQWLMQADGLRNGTRVLLEQPAVGRDPLPVVMMQFVGAGKVVFHATDESWRWRGNPAGDEYYQRYWLQTIRYLSRSQVLGRSRDAELTSDREQYAFAELVQLRVHFLDETAAPDDDAGVLVVVQRENGNRRLVTMQRPTSHRDRFLATVPGLAPGRYRAWMADPQVEGESPEVFFTIQGATGENTRKGADLDDLRRAAGESGGRLLRIDQLQDLPRLLPLGRQVRLQSRPPRPIWNNPWLALLFVTLITSEWLLRKRSGLV
jgi:hypothetical protein